MVGRVCANRVRRMTRPLPRRLGAAAEDTWAWFAALATQSRSASELGSVLGRRIIVHPLRHHEFTPKVPLERLQMLGAVEPVALEEHLLIDGDPPHLALGLSSALVVPGRLPPDVRWGAEHRDHPVGQLLDASGSFWTADLLQVEELTAAAASFPSDRSPDTRMLRLTRRLSLIGTPVAVVLDEIPEPRQPVSPARDEGAPLARH